MDDARRVLEGLIRENGCNFSALSRLLGRNDAYIQQYLRRHSPRVLDDSDIGILAQFFGVDPGVLGGSRQVLRPIREVVLLPVLDGHKRPGRPDAAQASHTPFAADWLTGIASSGLDQLAIMRLRGEAMEPTLLHDDEIILDLADGAARLRDGLYALRMDESLSIRRIALEPHLRKISVVSDNPAYPSWHGLDRRTASIVGRVVWFGRRLP